jgi:hypothetical protein
VDVVLKVKDMRAMAKRARAVSDMEIDEISLVDRPANQHAVVAIAKRANEEDAVPEDYFDQNGDQVDLSQLEDGDIVFDEDGQAFQYTADGEDDNEYADEGEYAEVGKADNDKASGGRYAAGIAFPGYHGAVAGRKGKKLAATGSEVGHTVAGQVGGAAAGGAVGALAGAAFRNPKAGAGIGAGLGNLGGSVAGRAKAVQSNQAKGRYKPQVSKSFADEVREELSKAVTEADRDEVLAKALGQIEAYEGEIAEAQEIAKSERELRLTREYIAKAAEYNVPVDPAELGPVLMRCAENLEYEDCAVLHKALSAAGQMLFDELGFQGEADNDDPFTQIEAELEQQVAKGREQMSKAEAVTKYFDNDPRAYDEYRASLGQ